MRSRLIVYGAGLLLWVGAVDVRADCGGGLRDDKGFVALLEQAIDKVNRVLPEGDLSLALSNGHSEVWDLPAVVPVSSVVPSRSDGVVAQVLPGCREIVLDGIAFSESFPLIAGEDSMLEGRETDLLALLLLHELGHVAAGHHGQFLPADGPTVLNVDENTSKAAERVADAYVAEHLRRHIEAIDTGEGEMAAFELALLITQLSLEIGTQASLDCFGCRILAAPDIFWDHSRSHENLEYRLLQLDHAISQTETSAELLRDYERQREGVGAGGFQIIQPDGTRRAVDRDSEDYRVIEDLLEQLEHGDGD